MAMAKRTASFFKQMRDGGPHLDAVTVATARVLARELSNRTALDAMVRAIIAAAPGDYDS